MPSDVRPRWLRVLSSQVLNFPKDGQRLDSLCGQFLPRLNYPQEEKNYPVWSPLVSIYVCCLFSSHCEDAGLSPTTSLWVLGVFGPPKATSNLNKPISHLPQQPCAEPDPVCQCVALYWVTPLGTVLWWRSKECWADGDNPFPRHTGSAPADTAQGAVGPLCCQGTAGSRSACCPQEEFKKQRNKSSLCIFN